MCFLHPSWSERLYSWESTDLCNLAYVIKTGRSMEKQWKLGMEFVFI